MCVSRILLAFDQSRKVRMHEGFFSFQMDKFQDKSCKLKGNVNTESKSFYKKVTKTKEGNDRFCIFTKQTNSFCSRYYQCKQIHSAHLCSNEVLRQCLPNIQNDIYSQHFFPFLLLTISWMLPLFKINSLLNYHFQESFL